MKVIQRVLAMSILTVLTLVSCQKDQNPVFIPDIANTSDFVQKRGPQLQSVTFNTGDLPKTITLDKGTKITIPAGALKMDGEDVEGEVTLEALEFLDRKDILAGGGNTNHISGAPLYSDGFIFIDFKNDGKSVDKDLANPINIAIPAKRDGFTLIWEGKVDDNGQFAWDVPGEANGNNPREVKGEIDGDFAFDFGQLGWVNCDVLWEQGQPQTTLRVKVLNNPGTFANFRGFSGETFVFFCGKGSNVAAHLYTLDGADGVKSYDDMMPMGVEGRLLAFSIKDGRFYLAKKDITVTENLTETLTLEETTEAAIQSEINDLNDY